MAADVNVTRRKKVLAHLAENGGALGIQPLHDWAGLKLLAAHQAFSQLMEGLVSDGLVGWDGSTFTLTDEGKAEAAKARPAAKKGKKAGEAVPAAVGERVAEPIAEPAPALVAVEVPLPAAPASPAEPAPVVVAAAPSPSPVAPPLPEARDHGHSHGHSHDHGHDHGHADEAPREVWREPKRAAPPPPPPKKGIRATVKGFLRGLIGR